MVPNIGRYLNKTILVGLKGRPGNEQCAPYTLLGVELVGLWLEGGDLASTYLTPDYTAAESVGWRFFVPFAQIACVAVPGPVSATSAEKNTTAPAPATRKKTKT